MDNETLKKVQLTLLEIAKEVKRVCDENNIQYFLDSGTLLGAVRHGGFIPWDDDFDIGMMRSEYLKFCAIAPKKLKKEYFLQTWENDSLYAVPFAKVRKKNTVYMEDKASIHLNNGFYVDIFPYDYAPSTPNDKKRLMQRLAYIERVLLMKCNYRPWQEHGGVNIKKKVAYIPYRCVSAFFSKQYLIEKYERLVYKVPESDELYIQFGSTKGFFIPQKAFGVGSDMKFEDTSFRCPDNYDLYLSSIYGDYMKLPPVDQRENRHQIIEIKF